MSSINKPLPDFLETERLLSARQAADLLSISTVTFRRQYWAGKLPSALRVSERRLAWRTRDLLRHLDENASVTI